MALIKCPDCQSEVSDAAPACLKCGRPIASAPTTPKRTSLSSTSATTNPAEPTKASKVVALVILFIIVVSGINYALQNSSNTSAPVPAAAVAVTTPKEFESLAKLSPPTQQQSQSISGNENVRLNDAMKNPKELLPQSLVVATNNGPGFEPVAACHFLSSNTMFTKGGDYTPMWDDTVDDYSCGTTYFQLGPATGDGLANNISMYGRGTSKTVKRVNLLLNVNDAGTFDKANAAFRSAASDLFKAALHKNLDKQMEAALKTSTVGTWMVGSYKIELLRDDWPRGKGYSLNFVIRDPAFTAGF
jgi:hypothetical protein